MKWSMGCCINCTWRGSGVGRPKCLWGGGETLYVKMATYERQNKNNTE